MAIALDLATGSSCPVGTTVGTLIHTCTGNNLILFAGVLGGTVDQLSNVAYSGVNMAQIGKIQMPAADNRFMYLYYLTGANTGANNMIATFSGTQSTLRIMAVSYTGANQSNQPDAFTSGTTKTGTVLSGTVTTVANNCWLTSVFRMGDGYQSAGANTTLRNNIGAGSNAFTSFADSNGPITPAGQGVLNVNGTDINGMGIIMASFSPFIAGNSIGWKTLLGVGQ